MINPNRASPSFDPRNATALAIDCAADAIEATGAPLDREVPAP